MTTLNKKYADLGKAQAIIANAEQVKKKPGPKKLPMLIPVFTPHQLRHTYITMLYLAGVDVLTAKEQAGHADISTTLGFTRILTSSTNLETSISSICFFRLMGVRWVSRQADNPHS